jgi:hypothetical protein
MELGADVFLKQYFHPFLLYPDDLGHGGFRTYHTRMADRGHAVSLSGTHKKMLDYIVLVPNTSQPTSKLLVGRSEERDIYVDHSTVSKRHAFFLFDEENRTYKLGDAGSTNGTFINGQPVAAGQPVFIRDGNVVSFGDRDFLFFSPAGFSKTLARLAPKG